MRIAACQLPDIRRNLPLALSLIETSVTDATRQGAQLVCFPECFLQGYAADIGYVSDVALDLASSEFKRILRSLKGLEPTIVIGTIERKGHSFFNSAVVVEHGELIGCYRKTHLLEGEQAVFSPGDQYPVFNVGGVKVGVNICYDLNFRDSVEAVALAGAQLVACPCNNMMRRVTAEKLKHVHNEIRSQRAREARVWLLSSDVVGERDGRVSYGPTAVINPVGIVIDQVPLMTTGMVVAEIQ
jgi:predicted amidohydrolase